jgi:VanZ family protein
MLIRAWFAMQALVIFGTLLPGQSSPMLLLLNAPVTDKAFHSAAYAALSFLPAMGVRINTLVLCVAISESIGIALEFGQAFVPGRSFDVEDILANSVGIVVGLLLAAAVRYWATQRA